MKWGAWLSHRWPHLGTPWQLLGVCSPSLEEHITNNYWVSAVGDLVFHELLFINTDANSTTTRLRAIKNQWLLSLRIALDFGVRMLRRRLQRDFIPRSLFLWCIRNSHFGKIPVVVVDPKGDRHGPSHLILAPGPTPADPTSGPAVPPLRDRPIAPRGPGPSATLCVLCRVVVSGIKIPPFCYR